MNNATTRNLLYGLSLIGSGAGFVTQMLVSGFWTTAYSQDVFYFSVNVAFYFLSLGIGSLLSDRIKKLKVDTLLWIAAILSFWSGLSISILRFLITNVPNKGGFPYAPILVVSVAGILAGMLIPLTLRVGEGKIGAKLSTLFLFDYTAAIFFTLIFTFVLLIPQGYSRTAIILSLACLATIVLLGARGKLLTKRFVAASAAFAVVPILIYFALKTNRAPRMDASGGDDAKVLYSEQSHYQKIVLTEESTNDPYLNLKKQHVLYLDGFVQFSTVDEQTYHFCLANIPVIASSWAQNQAQDVLVLGGGDGLAVRNLLGFREIKNITLVELDPAMIRLAKRHPIFLQYNQNSLASPRAHVVITDAFRWAATHQGKYDVIIIDFPAPKNLTLARLFSAEFYAQVLKLLKPKGVISVQAGPSFSLNDPNLMTLSEVTTSIRRTFEVIGAKAYTYVTPRDGEAFVLATLNPDFDMAKFAKAAGFYGETGMGELCTYHDSWKEPPVQANTLNTLKVSTYMIEWFQRIGGPFFNFGGNHAIFLPD